MTAPALRIDPAAEAYCSHCPGVEDDHCGHCGACPPVDCGCERVDYYTEQGELFSGWTSPAPRRPVRVPVGMDDVEDVEPEWMR